MILRGACMVFALLLSSDACIGQSATQTSIVVRTNGMVALTPSSIHVEYAGKEARVTHVAALGTDDGAPVEIAVLIDEAVRTKLNKNWPEIKAFIGSLPSRRIAVGVGYARQGHVTLPYGFTTDSERALKALDAIPAGQVPAQTLMSVSEIAQGWPIHPSAARVVLLLTTGGDVNEFVGDTHSSEDVVAPTVVAAQRAAIPIYSIDCSSNSRSLMYLTALADGTGGEVLDGLVAWSSLDGFFAKFKQDIGNSYLVQLDGGTAQLSKLKVSATISGVKLHTQKQAAAR